MYERHFGLNKRLFRANATGSDVFVGPNTDATTAAIKKALSANDAIVSISGAVGSGKTTLTTHALGSVGNGRIVVRVGRMRLASEDVLELLLDELGVEDKPRGTIQRFAVLRRKLKELEENKTRVFVTIEDSARLGADTLAEIEALTSADAGESEGTNVVLMGDDNLKTLLGEPQLVRLQQRIRQRFTVTGLCATDLHAYLQHCFRLAGGEFENVFEANAAQLLHSLSGGIPRISNNLVESAMTAAVEQNLERVASALLSQVAKDNYGLSTDDFDVTPAIEPPPVPEPSPPPEPPVSAQKESSSDEQDIPALIQDTFPDLKILVPEVAVEPVPAKAEVAVEPVPQPVPQPETQAEIVPDPVQQAEPPSEIESSAEGVPAWDRDPTMAELKPDLQALEQAMAFAQGASTEPVAADEEPLPEPKPEAPEVMPEITLDNAINERIESKLADKAGEEGPPPAEGTVTDASNTETPAAVAPQEQDTKANAELQKIAVELSKAKSIEDIDDKLAETLFGEELNLIAAQFAVVPPSAESANDDSEAVAGKADDKPVQEAADRVPAIAPQGPQSGEKPAIQNSGKPVTVSQRIRTVRALNVDSTPATPRLEVPPKPEVTPKPEVAPRNHLPISDPSNTPDSIEDQINTSISDTQAQRVLNVVPSEDDDDQDDEDTQGGFFSRFKRS